MKTSTEYRVCRLCGHRLGGPQARRVSAGRWLEQARIERAAASTRGDRPVGRGTASALRRTAHCRVPGDRQGAAGVCAAALRVLGAVPGQPDHPGEVPGNVLRERGQGRSQRRAARPGLAGHSSGEAHPAGSAKRGPMRVLQQLVEQRRTLVDDVRRITNRITDALKQYFPQVLDWFEDKDTLVFCDFLTHWPTLKQAQRARQGPSERLLPRAQRTLPSHHRAAHPGHPDGHRVDLRRGGHRPQSLAGRGP